MIKQPHDHTSAEIEKQVLAVLMSSENVRHQKLMQIRSEDFLLSKNKIIFEAIRSLTTDVEQNFDLPILSNYLKKQQQMPANQVDIALGEIIELFVSDQFFDQYLKILINNSTKAQIQQKITSWNKSLTAKNTRPDQLLKQIDLQTKELTDFCSRSQIILKPLHKIVDEVVGEWKHFREQSHKITCTTGFHALDDKIHGFQKGDLVILAARPSMGKTALALKVAVKNAYPEKDNPGDVIIFSLEMSSYQLVQRIFHSHLSEVNLRNLNATNQAKIDEFSQKLTDASLFIDTSMAIDVHSISFKLRSWVQKRPIKLVIIDYLQLLKPVLSEKFDNRNLEIAHWTRILKELARELNIPILCLSQLSRYVDKRDDKRPVLSDLRDSGSIEQDSDLVLFLYREQYYQKKSSETSTKKDDTKEKFSPNKAEVIIAKHRNGPTGIIELLFVPKKVTFYDVE